MPEENFIKKFRKDYKRLGAFQQFLLPKKNDEVEAEKKLKKRLFLLVASVISILCFVFVLVLEANFFEVKEEGIELVEVLDDSGSFVFEDGVIETGSDSSLRAKIDGGVYIDLDKDSRLIVEKKEDALYLDLEKGRFWVDAFSYRENDLNVEIPGVVLVPNSGVFDVEIKDDRSHLRVFNRSVYVGLMGLGEFDFDDVLVEGDNRFLNGYYVYEGQKSDIILSRINSNVQKLLFSKIRKDFLIRNISSKLLEEDEWIAERSADLKRRLLQVGLNYEGRIRNLSSRIAVNEVFGESIDLFANVFIVSDSKKEKRELGKINDSLSLAEFYMLEGDKVKANEVLNAVSSLSLFDNREILWDRYEELVYTLPGDSLYLSRRFLEDNLEVVDPDYFDRDKIRNVFDLMFFDKKVEALAALDQVISDYDSKLIESDYRAILRLMHMYPEFYKLDYISFLSDLEDKILGDDPSDDLLLEVILNKSDLIKKMRNFMLADEEISLKEGRDIMVKLIRDIDDLSPNDSDVAFLEILAEELQDFNLFVEFLNANANKALVGTFKENFDEFLENNSENEKLGQFLDSIFSDEIEQINGINEQEILANVSKDFVSAGIGGFESDGFDEDGRFLAFSDAKYKSLSLIGSYDVENKVFIRIEVDDDKFFDVSLNRFSKFMDTYINSQNSGQSFDPLIFEDDNSSDDKVLKLEKNLIVEKMFAEDLVVSISNIEKLEGKNYRILEAQVLGEIFSATFDYDDESEEVFNVSILFDGENFELSSSVELDVFTVQLKRAFEKLDLN